MTMEADKNIDFSSWYNEIIEKVDIIDKRYPVQGMPVYKDWGYRTVRYCIRILEDYLENSGHKPMLFPVLISEESFKKEKDHLEGLAGEVFWITKAGENKLDRKLLMRPTSETAMYPMFNLWIRTHADLPLKIHQSVSVYRYETKHTRPLFRGREFLWNEAHTAHVDRKDAENQVMAALEIYNKLFREHLALKYLILKRPDYDKFPGADYSIAFDAWNPNGRVNQIGTIHNLGKNFSKPFDINYVDEEGNKKKLIQTCYGIGFSRVLAALICQAGDNDGLILIPEIAPIQVVIVPIFYEKNNQVIEKCREIKKKLENQNIRVHIDDREKIRPGAKYYHWEERGVPFRIEIGPRDIKNKAVMLVDRITKKKEKISQDKIYDTLKDKFRWFREEIKKINKQEMEKNIVDVKDKSEIEDVVANGMIARACWCGIYECAEVVECKYKAEIRGSRFDKIEEAKDKCIICGKKSKEVVYIAKAY